MKSKISSTLLVILSAAFIAYGSAIESFHSHTLFDSNCPVCHFQITNAADIQQPDTAQTSTYIELNCIQPLFYIESLSYQYDSRSPPFFL